MNEGFSPNADGRYDGAARKWPARWDPPIGRGFLLNKTNGENGTRTKPTQIKVWRQMDTLLVVCNCVGEKKALLPHRHVKDPRCQPGLAPVTRQGSRRGQEVSASGLIDLAEKGETSACCLHTG